MGEIADYYVECALDDYFGDYGMRYHRRPPDRTALEAEFPALDEDEMKEAPVEKYLRDEVKKLGGEHRKVLYQGRTGSPDDWCFLPGGVLLIVECKRPGKEPTKQQYEEIRWLCSMGFHATWVDTKAKIDELLAPFKEYEWL